MSAPYRIASPPVEEPAVEADLYAARLRALTRRTRVGGVLAVLAGLGVFVTALAHARAPRAGRLPSRSPELGAALAQLDDAHQAAAAREAHMQRAVRMAKDAPRSSRCTARSHGAFGPTPVTQVALGAGALESTIVRRAHADLEATRNALLAGTSRLAAASSALRDIWYAAEIVYIEEERSDPKAQAAGTFEPGHARGTAYVYDFATERVVCATAVESASSSALAYRMNSTAAGAPARVDDGSTLQRALGEDLTKQVQRAIALSTGL